MGNGRWKPARRGGMVDGRWLMDDGTENLLKSAVGNRQWVKVNYLGKSYYCILYNIIYKHNK